MSDPDQPTVLVSDRRAMPVSSDHLAVLARETLLAEDVRRCELSVSLVDDEEMADLHLRYMGEEGPTDVLSFPMHEVDERGVLVLGDVVIAPGVAMRNNPDDPDAELRLLLVHGVLHILGYDHENDDDRARMWERQERYSGVSVP